MTIKDIARHFNTSVSVVSRALNDSGYVNPEKRQAIKNYASRHHYQPSGTARQLKKGADNTIGVVIPWVLRNQMDFVPLLIESIYNAHRDCRLMIGNNEQTVDQLAAMQIPKLIGINITSEQLPAFQRAAAGGTKILNVLGYCPDFCSVRLTHEKAIYDSVKHLTNCGHRRIAYVGMDLTRDLNNLHLYYLKMIRQGLSRAAEEEKLDFQPEKNMIFGIKNYIFDHQNIRRMLLDYRPTALLVWTEQAEAAVYAVCREMDLAIPEDISVIGLGGNFMLDGFSPPLTHYRFDYAQVVTEVERFIRDEGSYCTEEKCVDFLFKSGQSIKNINQ